MYGPLLGIYAIPNLENYMGIYYLIQSGIALFLFGEDFIKMASLSLTLLFLKIFPNLIPPSNFIQEYTIL